MNKVQSGFSALISLLIILVLVGLGGAGYYVWRQHHNKSLPKSIANFVDCVAAGNPVRESYPEQCSANGRTYTNPRQKQLKDTKANDETSNWLLYTSADETFSFKVPDGWKLYYQTDSDVVWGTGAQLTYKAGTRAIMTPISGGRDGIDGFLVAFDAPGTDRKAALDAYDKTWEKSTFTAQAGSGVRYSWNQTQEPETALGPPPGSTSYVYYFKKGDKAIFVSYVHLRNAPANQLDLAEKAIKTIQFL